MKRVFLLTIAAALLTAVTSCDSKMDAPDPVLTGPIDMVYVEGGTFQMGAVGVAEPVHPVRLDSYSIGKFPVTQAQWVAVMGANPSNFKAESDRPVETVSWNDIVGTTGGYMDINGIRYYDNGFIYRLNAITGKRYRLPTEAEWEYAARGGKLSKGFTHSGSNTVADVAWTSGTGSTKPVGLKLQNELGIYDMSGNVWEWCSDYWQATSTYYNSFSTTTPTDNPKGPATGSWRVMRGGSWNNNATRAHVSYRDDSTSPDRFNNVGFRLAL